MTTDKIAFVGLGSMGAGMAGCLVASQQRVVAYDVAEGARRAFVAAGGNVAASTTEAATDARVFVLVVASDGQAESVLFGDGVVGALPPGATVVLHSTVPPAYAEALGKRLAERGLHLLDAPMTGGVAAAAAGQIMVMASGGEAAFAAATPVIERYAKRIVNVGPAPGQGSTMKMAHQLLAGVHIATAAEALALATRAGIDPALFFDVATSGAANSWMLGNRGARMVSGDFTTTSAVEIFVKDLGIVLDGGRALRFPLPLAAAAHQQFLAAAAAGHGRIDDAAVVKVYEMLAGISVAGAAKAAAKKT
ncbi:MAG: NAD(P)-binding domain-containing protein [Alphaproteobacteria bacterium]